MVDQVSQDDMQDSAPLWFEIDPWGSAPDVASKFTGLGGMQPSPDPAYVFQTAFLKVEPGPFRMRIVMSGCEPSDSALLLEILNRSNLPGSPPVRMRLVLGPLQAFVDANGHYDVTIEASPNTHYALAAFLHEDRDLGITDLRVFVDRPVEAVPVVVDQAANEAPDPAPGSKTRDTARLTSTEPPSFTNPFSQPWTPSQELEPAFLARCAELDLSPSDTPDSWSEAFVLQVLGKYGALVSGRAGIVFDGATQAVAQRLLRQGASVVLTRFVEPGAEIDLGSTLGALRPDDLDELTFFDRASFTPLAPCSLPKSYFGRFDFAWWIAPGDAAPLTFARQLDAVASSLKPGGLGVVVVPFDPGHAFALGLATEHAEYPARHAIERLALEAVAQGHSVAQLRFGPPIEAGRPDVSRFGLIVLRE